MSTREHSGPSLLGDLVLGAAAGGLALMALDKVDWAIWNRLPASSRARTIAVRPGGRDPAHEMAHRLAELCPEHPTAAQVNKAGDVIHVLLGLSPAMIYAVLRSRVPGVAAGRGALFGAALFLIQDEGLNTVMKFGAPPRDYPWADHARGLVAHVTYGVALDAVLSLLDGFRRDPYRG